MPNRGEEVGCVNSVGSFLSQFPSGSPFVFGETAFGLVSPKVVFEIQFYVADESKEHAFPCPWTVNCSVGFWYQE